MKRRHHASGRLSVQIIQGHKGRTAYQKDLIYKHRNRYELNNHFREQLVEGGPIISGISLMSD